MEEARLHELLRALASPVRIQLLRALETPRHAAEIRLPPARERTGLRSDRSLSRPAIIQHLNVLERLGLIRRIDDHYVVDQRAMFALLDELGALARLRPVVELDVVETIEGKAPDRSLLPDMPRLMLVGGPRDGAAFHLHGPGPWVVGRGATADVRLEYDPHVSRAHLVIERDGDGFVVKMLEDPKNVATLDLLALPRGRNVPLQAGAVVGVGASHLVFQAT